MAKYGENIKVIVAGGENVHVDYSQMTKTQFDTFARDTLEAVRRFFEIPGVQEDYERWLVEYKKQQEENELENQAN